MDEFQDMYVSMSVDKTETLVNKAWLVQSRLLAIYYEFKKQRHSDLNMHRQGAIIKDLAHLYSAAECLQYSLT